MTVVVYRAGDFASFAPAEDAVTIRVRVPDGSELLDCPGAPWSPLLFVPTGPAGQLPVITVGWTAGAVLEAVRAGDPRFGLTRVAGWSARAGASAN